MISRPLRAQLVELTAAQLDGRATAEQIAQLESRLIDSGESRQFYIDHLDLHARLSWESGASAVAPPTAEMFAQQAAGTVPSWPMGRQRTSNRVLGFLGNAAGSLRSSTAAATLGVAVLVYGLFGLMVWQMSQHKIFPYATNERIMAADPLPAKMQAAEGVATLIRGEHCVWGEMRDAPRNGEPLKPRMLRLVSGAAELQFHGGARVIVEGPAEFELRTTARGWLKRGKLVAHVPPRAIGFTIATPAANVVDLGTEFGVEVRSRGNTAVEVFQGQVRVEPTKKDGVAATSQGHGVILRADKNRRLEVDAATGEFVQSERFSQPLAFKRVLAEPEGVANTPADEFLKALQADKPLAVWLVSKARQGIIWNEIGDRHHGKLVGNPKTPGEFDGVDDSIEFRIPPLGQFTVEAWFKTGIPGKAEAANPWAGRLLLRIGALHGTDYGITLADKRLYCHDTAVRSGYLGKTEVVDGRWRHVAMICEPGRPGGFKLYVDGTMELAADALPTASSTDHWLLSCVASKMATMTPERFFAGSLHTVAVYPHALDAKSIELHYRAGMREEKPR